MKYLSIEFSKVKSCMDTSGGVDGCDPNETLNAKLKSREVAGVIILPSFFVNQQAALCCALTNSEVFDAICSSYGSGSEPETFVMCNKRNDVPAACISIGHCHGSSPPNYVYMPAFAAALFSVIFLFSCIGLVQWQQTQ
jgi:hypothetical protein